eukprot:gene12370-13640_t
MGSVLGVCSLASCLPSLSGCCGAQILCCCGPAACGLCCKTCPSCKNSTSSRIGYILLLLLGFITSCIMQAPGIRDKMDKIPHLCNNKYIKEETCNNLVGYLAVYRVCFAMAAFFLLMALITIKVKSSKDRRSSFQNGFWFIKLILFIGLIVAAFFIPKGSFSVVWMYVGMIGASLFIVIQLIMLIDFAYSWSESWVEKHEESGSKCWLAGLMISTGGMYILCIAASTLLFIFYAKNSECGLNKFFILFNIFLIILVSVLAIHPKVQQSQPSSGLLQAAVIATYTVYITWSGLSNEPDDKCNPSGLLLKNSNLVPNFDGQTIIAAVVLFVTAVYSCVKRTSSRGKSAINSSSAEEILISEQSNDEESKVSFKGQNVYDNEESEVAYNYSLFHVAMMLASLYIMMTLTNWYSPRGSDFSKLTSSWATVWVKIASSWVCFGLYTWTLVAPLLFPDRDFM